MQVDEESGALAPPIHLSTTFLRSEEGAPSRRHGYIREGNPTQDRLEEALAAIDSGAAALFFSSGMAAVTAVLEALPAGAHVLLPDDGYYGVRVVARELMPRWGVSCDIVAMEDLSAVRAAMRPETALLWAESPSNPLLKIVDLRALAGIAHGAGARFAVDGTFATPALQRPIELGSDLVFHSTTKYFGGHSDVHGGSLAFASKDDLFERCARLRYITGSVGSPFSAWLVLRGIRSLAARMRVHAENAAVVARFLAGHARVEAVYYPGLESHAGHVVARAQMSAFGGMLSFLVRGSREETLRVAARTQLFVRATSLGGVESLIEHRHSSEGPGSTTPENLLRLSVGLEHSDDLVADLLRALE